MDDDDNPSAIKLLKALVSLISTIVVIVQIANGKTKLDIPNAPVNIDVPQISDGDDSIVVKDFSLVTTVDEKMHFCYEMSINGETKYFDVVAKKLIDSNYIKSIETYEDEISDKVPTVKGYGYKKDLDNAIDNTIETYGIKIKKIDNSNTK